MIITFFMDTHHRPEINIRGDLVKIEIGPVFIEMDVDAFKEIMITLLTKASEKEINFTQK